MTAGASPGVQQHLELGDAARQMSFTEAAFRLMISRAELCELILAGGLLQVGRGLVDRAELEKLATHLPSPQERMRRGPDRLVRTTETFLWLLADWGGNARITDLAAGMEVTWQSAHGPMQKLVASAFVERSDRAYTLTDKGRAYVEKYRRSSLG